MSDKIEIPESEYADAFDTLGEVDLGELDGKHVKLTLFQCHECGSAISARALHFAMHHKLILKEGETQFKN